MKKANGLSEEGKQAHRCGGRGPMAQPLLVLSETTSAYKRSDVDVDRLGAGILDNLTIPYLIDRVWSRPRNAVWTHGGSNQH